MLTQVVEFCHGQTQKKASILVERIIVDVTTKSSGACTLDFGVTAVSATTSSDTLLDGINVASAGVFDNLGVADASAKSVAKIASGKWITGSKATGAAAGLAGFAYIYYTIA